MATVFVKDDDWADFDPRSPQSFKLTPVAPPKPKKPSQRKQREQDFADQCKSYMLPTVYRDYHFALPKNRLNVAIDIEVEPRKWRFDFCFGAPFMLAVEIEGLAVRRIGGQFVCTGRHTTPEGFAEDAQKYANAVLLGWTVVRFTTNQARPGRKGAPSYAISMTQRILLARGWKGPNA